MVISKLESDFLAGESVTVTGINVVNTVSKNSYSSFTVCMPHVFSINVSFHYDAYNSDTTNQSLAFK